MARLMNVGIVLSSIFMLCLICLTMPASAQYYLASNSVPVQFLKYLAELPARTIRYFSRDQQLETYELSERDCRQIQRALSALLLSPQEINNNYADILKQAKTAVATYAAVLNDLPPTRRIPINVLQDIRKNMFALGANFGILREATSATALSSSTLTYASTTGMLPTHIVSATGSIDTSTETTRLLIR